MNTLYYTMSTAITGSIKFEKMRNYVKVLTLGQLTLYLLQAYDPCYQLILGVGFIYVRFVLLNWRSTKFCLYAQQMLKIRKLTCYRQFMEKRSTVVEPHLKNWDWR